jgi:hypothetical protein
MAVAGGSPVGRLAAALVPGVDWRQARDSGCSGTGRTDRRARVRPPTSGHNEDAAAGDEKGPVIMIQNILATVVGALVALVALLLIHADNIEGYVTGLVIGGIASLLWPIVMGIWLGRRAKARRDEQMQQEVQRQVDQQSGSH